MPSALINRAEASDTTVIDGQSLAGYTELATNKTLYQSEEIIHIEDHTFQNLGRVFVTLNVLNLVAPSILGANGRAVAISTIQNIASILDTILSGGFWFHRLGLSYG